MAHRTTTIDRTTELTTEPPVVFAVVNSPETAHLIDPAVHEWSADSRPIGVGTRFTIRGRLGIVPIRATSQVVVWDPPRLSEFRSVTPAWPVRMTARHRFEERSDGGTEYTWSISFEEVSFVARPIIAILSRLFRRAFAAQSEALESFLSQRGADDPAPAL
ncbi:MAG TPA: SRPBCC family protein [Ilumatobacteraceae bacterium]|nr:SRPBCC family protein [Ilumatobacteraceae bacterium]